MRYILNAGKAVTPRGILPGASIILSGEKIAEVRSRPTTAQGDAQVISLDKYTVLPGLIDLHIHGVNGHDTMDASFEALNGMSNYLARQGVTSFLAATVTAGMDKILGAVENIANCRQQGLHGARLLGAYIEGPYLNPENSGAHCKDCLRELDSLEIEAILAKAGGNVRVFALAPEKENAIPVIQGLTGRGIKVALGHSSATYGETNRAIETGASIAVHTFNGMGGLHHREPGIVGAVLNSGKIMAELIADGVHVAFPVIEILLKCKDKEDIILITDCMRAGGLGDGEYELGELKVRVKDGIARTKEGSLAGSTLRLIDGVKNLVQKVNVPLADAVHMASLNPARALGQSGRLGSIAEGKQADLIAIDDEFNVVFTMVGGKIVCLEQKEF
ncbi:MAG TPA: N-acetylglucosamine-6-phosphate deacetylase [Firmicutes bacterium]|jgi:N-acetylglucosamine-6-phosphate deacetylase|nr:N-acetylglucosamine-6-phosphate deacetylase [Bacillota bacterium]